MPELRTSIKSAIKNKELRDIVSLIFLQGVNYIMPVLVLPYLITVIGAEGFGIYSFALSVCQYLILIVDFGFNLSATKQIAIHKGNKEKVSEIFSHTVYAKLFLMIISLIIAFALSLIPNFAIYREAIFVMFGMVIGHTLLYVFLFQGLDEIRWVSFFTAIAKFMVLPLTFIFVKGPEDLYVAVFLQGFVSVVAAIISLIMIGVKKWVRLVRFSFSGMWNAIKDAFPIFLSSAATSIYAVCFVLILGYFATADVVGQYSASERIMRVLVFFIFTPIMQVFYPKVSRIARTNKIESENLYRKILYGVICLMSLICIGIYILSYIIVPLAGDDYMGTESIMRIMCLTPIFIGTGGVIGQIYILALSDNKYKKYFTKTYIMAAIVAIISIFIFIPTLKAQGAAIALLITEVFVMCSFLYYKRKINKLGAR
ncbi:MAG: flippase [Paludibacteraceae bacterium]|nr:flippase [Paludibacteraceae bacterium]